MKKIHGISFDAYGYSYMCTWIPSQSFDIVIISIVLAKMFQANSNLSALTPYVGMAGIGSFDSTN